MKTLESDGVIVLKHYLQILEDCNGMTCNQPDLLEHKICVFTNAIAYARYIYPNVVRFLDHVQVLMKQIVDGELEGLEEECEERRSEGKNLETDGSIFAASRLSMISRNLRKFKAELQKEADKVKGIGLLDKLTGKILSKKMELSDLTAALESTGKLDEYCSELRKVFLTIDKLVEVVVIGIGDIRHHLGSATEAEKDGESQTEIIYYEVRDEAAKLLQILEGMLDSNTQTLSTVQDIADRGSLDEAVLSDWRDCFAKHRSDRSRYVEDAPQSTMGTQTGDPMGG